MNKSLQSKNRFMNFVHRAKYEDLNDEHILLLKVLLLSLPMK